MCLSRLVQSVLLGLVLGCGTEASECVPAEQGACSCDFGEGLRTCHTDGKWLACVCDLDWAVEDIPADSPPGRSGQGTRETERDGSFVPFGRSYLLARASGGAVAVISYDAGISIATDQALLLFDREGNELAQAEGFAGIQAAAGSGELLAVARGSRLTVFKVSDGLSVLAEVDTPEPCTSLVFVSGERLICSSSRSQGKNTFTYDARMAKRIVTEESTHPASDGMLLAPGTDRYVRKSESGFELYEVASDNRARWYGHVDYDVRYDTTLAVIGTPAEYLVTDTGVLLDFRDESCSASLPEPTKNCLRRVGELGTLMTGWYFSAFADSPAGLATLVQQRNWAFQTSELLQNALLQRVDVAARKVRSSTPFAFPPSGAQLAFDSHTGRILGLRPSGRDSEKITFLEWLTP